MNEAEVLSFHARLWGAERKWGANTEHQGVVILFVWAYKIECICFENIFFSFTISKITEKVTKKATGYW